MIRARALDVEMNENNSKYCLKLEQKKIQISNTYSKFITDPIEILNEQKEITINSTVKARNFAKVKSRKLKDILYIICLCPNNYVKLTS